MELAGDDCPVAKVVNNKDLVEDILKRSGSSVSMIRCRAVCSTWRAATRRPSFARSFGERTKPANIGFIVKMQTGVGRLSKLAYPLPSQGDETVDIMRGKVDIDVLGADHVLSSREGVVLTLGGEGGSSPEAYHTSCLWDNPRVYTPVATLLPRIPMEPEQRTVNTFGQFGVLPLSGRSGMSFFIKDAARSFIYTYAGVSFCSGADIFVHVNVLTDGQWVRYVSNPIPSPEAALFHTNPYSVLDGDTLYMMYLVGCIVCFDLGSKTFSELALCDVVGQKVLSWYDYTVAEHTGGGLVLVHYTEGMLHKWVLNNTINGAQWTLDSDINLIFAFARRFPPYFWNMVLLRESFPLGSDATYTVQVRISSTDGCLVFVTLGFDHGMYEVNMASHCMREIKSVVRDGAIRRIYHVAEPWPPAE